MLYYALICDGKILVLKSPSEKNSQNKSNKSNIVKFLGYDWSKRKGDEGIKYQSAMPEDDELKESKDDSDEEKKSKEALRNINSVKFIKTPLYNPSNKEDNSKFSFVIKSFICAQENDLYCNKTNDKIDKLIQSLQSSDKDSYKLFISDLKSMIDFSRADFSKAINLNLSQTNGANATNPANPFANSKFELVRLGEAIVENPKSQIKVAQAKENTIGKYPFYTSGLNIYRYDTALISGENIYLSTGGNAIVQFYEGESAYSTDTYAIKSKTDEILTKFLYLLLESITPLINKFYFKGMGLKHLQKTELKNMQIPKPPIEIQKQIVAECQKVESQSQNINDLIALYKDLIRAILGKCGISDIDASLPSLRESRSDSWQSTDAITTLLDLINKCESNLKSIDSHSNTNMDCHDLTSSNLAMTELIALLKSLPTPPKNGWESAKLDNLLLSVNRGAKIPKNKFLDSGKYPIISQESDSQINGWTNLENPIADLPVIVFGDHSCSFKFIDFPFFSGADGTQILKFCDKCDTKFMLYALREIKINNQEKYERHFKYLKQAKIPFPPLSEQNKIIAPIEWIESKITALDSTLHTLESQKSIILQKYLY